MKFNEITESASAGATGAGSVATVNAPMGVQKRSGSLFTGKKTKQKYANSVDARKQVSEGKMKEVAYDLDNLDNGNFKKKYGKTKEEMKALLKEEEISEQDLIVLPGMRRRKDTSFIPHAEDRRDHEVKMARSDLYAIAKNAKALFELIKDRSEDEGLMGWQQSYITLANDYLNSVRESIEYQEMMREASEYGQGEDDRINTGNILDKKPKGPNRVGIQGGEITGTSLAEKAVSKAQQKFMGMVHAAQKGEKPASKEVAKVAKTMKKKDAEDFASTKHKGLPEKK
jgi:hypothetical protein